jgi:F-type H+-transporting ATPase subunit c
MALPTSTDPLHAFGRRTAPVRGGAGLTTNQENIMNIPIMLAELGGSIHVGLAALGAAVGIGLIGQGASEAVGRNPGAATKILVQAMLSTAFAESIVFFALFLLPNK